MANLLLIDDQPGVRRILAQELAFEGHTVMTTGDVALVKEILRFSNLDLVILDPYWDGQHRWDLLLEIKQHNPHLPVLIITEFASYRRDLRSALAEALLVKSFEFSELVKKISEVLRQKQGHPFWVESNRRSIRMAPSYPTPPPEILGAHTGIPR